MHCLGNPRENHLLVDIELTRRILHIDSLLDLVRNQCYRIGNVVYELSYLQRIVPRLAFQQCSLICDEVLLILVNEVLDLVKRVLSRIRIRIIPVRDQHDLDIEPLLQDKSDAAQGRMDPGRITVVHDGYVVGKLLDETDLIDCQ